MLIAREQPAPARSDVQVVARMVQHLAPARHKALEVLRNWPLICSAVALFVLMAPLRM
jgi:hypothetical protein